MIFAPLSVPAMLVLANLSLCPEQPKIDVEVLNKTIEKPYDRDLSVKDLTRKHPLGHDMKTLGLTDSRISSDYTATFATRTDNDSGATCIVLKSFKLNFTYHPTVYIASDFRKNECRYDIVTKHENRHVAIDVAALKEFLPQISRKLGDAARSIGPRGPFPRRMLDDEQNRATKDIYKQIQPLIDKMHRIRIARQAELDTTANYRREKALCPAK